MDSQHAMVLKILANLDMLDERELSEEEQLLLDRALDEDLDFEIKVKELLGRDKYK